MNTNLLQPVLGLAVAGIVATVAFAFTTSERMSVVESRVNYISTEVSGLQEATDELRKATAELTHVTDLMRYQLEEQQRRDEAQK